MKHTIKILALAACALVMSSCSIMLGLRTDGKDGPGIFSFEQREHDTARPHALANVYMAKTNTRKRQTTL